MQNSTYATSRVLNQIPVVKPRKVPTTPCHVWRSVLLSWPNSYCSSYRPDYAKPANLHNHIPYFRAGSKVLLGSTSVKALHPTKPYTLKPSTLNAQSFWSCLEYITSKAAFAQAPMVWGQLQIGIPCQVAGVGFRSEGIEGL